MNKKRLIITSVISIVLVSILMMGSTYSIFTTSDVDEESNVYATGNLDITYTVDSESVTITEKEPLAIEDANTVTPYRITVTNNGTVPYMFDLILEDTTTTDVIDYQYIMTKVGSLEAKSLGSCTDNIIKEDIILSVGESVDIDVRVWISDTVSNTEINKSFFSKLLIEGIAIYDKNESIDNNVLSIAYMKKLFSGKATDDPSYFHSETYLTTIKNVAFVNYIDTTDNVASWDVSEAGDRSVMAWIMNNETSGYYDLYFGSEQVIFAKNLAYFFTEMTNIDSISFDNLDTSLVTDMQLMFYKTGYNSTTFSLNLGERFNTTNVTNMMKMFTGTGYASPVLTLDLRDKFNTSNVTNMSYMFNAVGYSSTVFTLDLGEKFDTSKVTDMNGMFKYAAYNSTIFSLDLGEKFNTSKVTDMSYMFTATGHTSSIFTLNLGENFNTSNVGNMQNMFNQTGFYSTDFTLDLGEKFDTSNVTNMMRMFAGVGQNSTIFTLDLGEKFDTSKVTDMSYMFNNTGYSYTGFTLDLGDYFDTSNVTNMGQMFAGVGYSSTVFTLDLGDKFYTTSVTSTNRMFSGIGYADSNLILDLSTFTFDKVTNYNYVFEGFTTTKKIYVANTTQQSWVLGKGFTNVTSDNVLIKNS